MNDVVIEYLSDQQCARQWKAFLRVFADELAAQWPLADRQAFMHRLGTRFAQQMALGHCQTLEDLQLAMGRIWVEIDWGWVALDQQDDHLRIRHYCAPLQAALGAEAADWFPAFLEGTYQEWFTQAQAGEALRVRQSAATDAAGSIEFRLGRG